MKKIFVLIGVFVLIFTVGFSARLNADYQSPIVSVVEAVSPAVVNIETTKRTATGISDPYFDDFFNRFFGGQIPQSERETQGLGTGFIFDKDGYILTNYHVVENATRINVGFSDGSKLPAVLIGGDSTLDIAVLKIETERELPIIELGNSSDIKIGEWAIAVGNPLGLEHTVTVGVVSAVNRRIAKPDGTGTYLDLIQTDAAINPGNSGGPLLNIHGEVIGINTAIVNTTYGVNLGFAIPINSVKSFTKSLIESGSFQQAYLGIYHQTVTEMLINAFGLKVEKGTYVADVIEGTAAYKSGLKPGDVIIKFNDTKIENSDNLGAAIRMYSPGDKIKLTINRFGEEIFLEVILGSREPETLVVIPVSYFGIAVREITEDDYNTQKISKNISGIVVEEIKPEAPSIGLSEGDIIAEVFVNGVKNDITNVEDWNNIASNVEKNSYVALIVYRDGIRFNAVFYY